MAKCRGCGGDTRDFLASPGWMHYECEIKRLQGALDEAEDTINTLDRHIPASIIDVANGDVKLLVDLNTDGLGEGE